MAGGIIVNGKFVARPGVYSNVRYITIPGAPTQGSTLAVVGEFPYLKQNTAYVVTSQRAFIELAPSHADHLRMASIIFNPSDDPVISAAPAQVVLLSGVPNTQAFGKLLDAASGDSIRINSKLWGTLGNRTRFRIVPNLIRGGWDVVIANNGVQETIRVPAEPSPGTLSYAFPVPVPTTPAAPYTTRGFGVFHGDTGSVVQGEVDDGDVNITFSKVLSEDSFDDDPAHISWTPEGPVYGPVTVDVAAGTVLSSGEFTVRFNGVDRATGLAATEDIVFSVAEVIAGESKVTTTDWATLDNVRAFTESTQTIDDGITLTGRNFAPLNAAGGQTNVAALLQFIQQYSADGFLTSTASTRTASILLTDLDDVAVGNLPLVLGADTWKIVTTVNEASKLVEAEVVGNLPPNIPTAGTFFWLLGGSETSITPADWADALEQLVWFNVDDLVAMYDTTGIPAASDAVLAAFKDHVATMWADGANERILWVGAGADEGYNTLVGRAASLNSERAQVVVDEVSLVQYTGAVERMRPHWYALMHAAAGASFIGVGSLTNARLRVIETHRNDALYDREVVDELIQAGLIISTTPPGGVPRVTREVTTWTVDDNPARTETICTRSLRASIKGMRAALESLQLPEASNRILVLADVQAMVIAELDRQKSGIVAVITNYDPSVSIVEQADRYEVGYTIVVRINKNFIILNAGVTVPVGSI